MSDTALDATARTRLAMADVLAGRRRGLGAIRPFVGPALVASIAYMDPGNFATNIQAGARYGYTLLWVVVVANAVAMLFQALSARVGIATGRNLAELCREALPRAAVLPLWLVSEIAAMATDLAEFLGGAIGLSLLAHLPLMAGMAVTGLVTIGIVSMDRGGFRPIERIIGALVGAIALCYLAEVLIAPVNWAAAGHGAATPFLADRGALVIAVGIVGATVMPHALYLHSGLVQGRAGPMGEEGGAAQRARRLLLRFSNREVVAALTVAGLVNLAMVVMAAAAFHAGHQDVASIDTAYRTLTPLLGAGAAGVFLCSLLASGVSSSVVGTLAGQMVMQGFLGVSVPLWLRRAVTMAPAFAVIGLGVDPTRALLLSQVVLSFALPVPMIALVAFAGRKRLMGALAAGPALRAASYVGAAIVLSLNLVLLEQVVAG